MNTRRISSALRLAIPALATLPFNHAAHAAAITVTTSADTYIREGSYANTIYGSATAMVSNHSGSNVRMAIFSFDISSFTADTITSAKLELQDTTGGNSNSYELWGLTDTAEDFVESTLTWNNANFLDSNDDSSIAAGSAYGGAKLADFNTKPSLTFAAFDATEGAILNFLNASEDGIVTFVIVDPSSSSTGTGWATKEQTTALAPTLTISDVIITPPPTVNSIEDDHSGEQIGTNSLVTYTVTFSQDIDSSTVSAADFGNAGKSTVSFGTITETAQGVFEVPVTPTSTGTLQLQINASATIDSPAGDSLDTTSAITDDTTYNVNNLDAVTRLLVVYVAGQSNADGRAAPDDLPTSPVDLQSPQDDIDFFYRVENTTYPLTTLRPGLSESAGFGPAISLGRRLADELADGTTTRVAIIKYANGGTSLYSDWVAGGDATTTGDGTQYKRFQETVTAGHAALSSTYPNAQIEQVGLIWVQGEKDISQNQAAPYQTNLTNFIADVRATLGDDLHFVVSRLSDGQTSLNATHLETVRTAQAAVAAADSLTSLVDTDGFGMKTDNLHFDAAGQQQLGEAAAIQMLNLYPYLSAPQLSVASDLASTVTLNNVFLGFDYEILTREQLDSGDWAPVESKSAAGDSIEFNIPAPAPGSTLAFFIIQRTITSDS